MRPREDGLMRSQVTLEPQAETPQQHAQGVSLHRIISVSRWCWPGWLLGGQLVRIDVCKGGLRPGTGCQKEHREICAKKGSKGFVFHTEDLGLPAGTH